MLKYLTLFFLSLLSANGSYEIFNMPSNARSLALNNSESIYDNLFLSSNPASLSIKTKSKSYSYILLPANIHYISYQNTRPIKIGSSANKLSYINYGTLLDSKTNEESLAYDILFEHTFKKELYQIISLGISSGFLFSNIADYKSNILFANIGFRTRLLNKKLGIGISFENLGYTINMYTTIREKIPSLFRLGIYYELKYIPTVLNINYINKYNINASDYIVIGSESKLDNIFIRFAINSQRKDLLTQDFSSDIISGISLGIGFNILDVYYDVGFKNLGPAGSIVAFSISKKIN